MITEDDRALICVLFTVFLGMLVTVVFAFLADRVDCPWGESEDSWRKKIEKYRDELNKRREKLEARHK